MFRKVLIIAFLLSVASNSLAAVLPYVAGDAACEGKCCRVVRRSDWRANESRLRCLMQCEHPIENQGVPESSLVRPERNSKAVALVAPGLQTLCSTLNARSLPSAPRAAFTSTPIYLKTGTLLI